MTDLQKKFANARTALCKSLVERNDEVDLVLIALLSKEHILLVGDPGTAKSHMLRGVASWMGNECFEHLLTKFTTPEELFGMYSIKALQQYDAYERKTYKKLPEATLVFLDEIWKASSAIINTLLTAMNERKFSNGNDVYPIPLWTMMSASNEWPNEDNGGKELNAAFDRFLYRKIVKPVSKAGENELLKRSFNGDECLPNFGGDVLTRAELETAHKEAMSLPITDDGKRLLRKIMDECKKNGIFHGNRRLTKYNKAVRAAAYLAGDNMVKPEHLEVLAHVIWTDPTEQPKVCEKIVLKHANYLKVEITGMEEQALDTCQKAEEKLDTIKSAHERRGIVEQVLKNLEILQMDLQTRMQCQQKTRALELIEEYQKDWQYKLINAKRD